MLKNKLVAALAVLGLSFFSYTKAVVASDKPVTLEGRTVGVEIISEDSRTIELNVTLDLNVKNNSNSNIILYTSDFDVVNLILFTTEPESKSKTILYRANSRSGNFQSPDIAIEQRKATSTSPGSEIARIVPPDQSFNLKKKTELKFLKTKIVGYPNESWEEVLKASPVSLTVQIELFPEYLNTELESNSSFGEKLKATWQPYGNLQLEEIKSDPISLDFAKAIPADKKEEFHKTPGNTSSTKKPETKTDKNVWRRFDPDITAVNRHCASHY